ncbi:MAG: hypothetical protein AB7N76_05095 [Planctomycetota bacterium]
MAGLAGAGCGGGGSSSAAATRPLWGSIVAGFASGASVRVYRVQVIFVSTASSGSDGRYQLEVEGDGPSTWSPAAAASGTRRTPRATSMARTPGATATRPRRTAPPASRAATASTGSFLVAGHQFGDRGSDNPYAATLGDDGDVYAAGARSSSAQRSVARVGTAR